MFVDPFRLGFLTIRPPLDEGSQPVRNDRKNITARPLVRVTYSSDDFPDRIGQWDFHNGLAGLCVLCFFADVTDSLTLYIPVFQKANILQVHAVAMERK